MDPWFARNRLSAYLDDTLPAAERAEVEAQLDADPALRQELDQLRAAVALVRAEGRVRAPEGFHDRVMARVASERPPAANRPTPAGRWRVVAALAVAAAVLLIVPLGRLTSPRVAPEITPDAPEITAVPSPADTGEPIEQPQRTSRVAQARQQARELRASPPEGAVVDARGTSASSGRARVTGLPATGTYAPSWDQDDQSQEIIGSTAGSTVNAAGVHRRPSAEWRITLAQTDALIRLAEIAREAGGELLDSRGRPVELRELTVEQNSASTQLVVPASDAEQVREALLGLGATEAVPLGEHADTDTVVFRVSVTYLP